MFNEYQQAGQSTFKPVQPDIQVWQYQLLDWAVGLGGETGEVLDLIKHHVFHGENLIDKMALAKELGDVLWYVSAIASTVQIDLDDIATLNMAKLAHRYGAHYSIEASQNRHAKEVNFEQTVIYKCLKARMHNTGTAPVSIITIGPDGSGKTTFTKALAELSGLKRIKCDYRQEDKVALASSLLDTETDVIYDRFYFPDELIYSAVKGIKLDEVYMLKLAAIGNMLKARNCIFLYIDAPIETLKERSAAWADDYIAIDDLSKIKEQYKIYLDMFKQLGIPIITIDSSVVVPETPQYTILVADVLQRINAYRVQCGTSNIIQGGVTNVKPSDSM